MAGKGWRKQESIRYEDLYEIFRIPLHAEGWTRCFYCGAPADTLDHQPPISRVSDYRALALEHERFVKALACRECNGLLGNELHGTLLEREEDLKARLRKKYRRYAELPDWNEDQLDDMGPRMRAEIRRSMRLKQAIVDRLTFIEGIRDYTECFEIEEMIR